MSTLAFDVDHRYFFVTAMTALFALLVIIRGVVFALQPRRTSGRASVAMTTSIPLELMWSILPFVTSMAILGWAAVAFLDRMRAPAQMPEIHSTAGDGCGGSSIAAGRAASASYTCRSDGPSR